MTGRFAGICFVTYGYVVLPLFSLGLGSCGDDPEIRRYRDTGALCLLPDDKGGTTIAIAFDECFSCGTTGTASCRATVIGDRVAISTALDIVNGERQDTPQECTGQCLPASATCELNVPAPGDYRIVLYGSRSATVTLPVTSPVQPYGDGECAR